MKFDVFFKVANDAGNTIHFIGFSAADAEDIIFDIANEPTVDDNSVIVNFIP